MAGEPSVLEADLSYHVNEWQALLTAGLPRSPQCCRGDARSGVWGAMGCNTGGSWLCGSVWWLLLATGVAQWYSHQHQVQNHFWGKGGGVRHSRGRVIFNNRDIPRLACWNSRKQRKQKLLYIQKVRSVREACSRGILLKLYRGTKARAR